MDQGKRNLFNLFRSCTFILCILFLSPIRSLAQQEDTLYEHGLQSALTGQLQKALQDWSRAASLPNAKPDPRIGLAYIGLAASSHLTSYYPMASRLYFWGFTTKNLTRFRQPIQKEIDRLGPLAGDKAHREWSRELKNGNPAVLDSIRGYWIRNNPQPSNPENERLLEHWQRIAYARSHFTRNKHSVYDCDDRGTIYVKYGQPDVVQKGKFIFDKAFAINLAHEISDRTKGLGSANENIINFIVRTAELKYFYPAGFEIWTYHNLSDQNTQNSVYLFGDIRDGGYRELSGVEEFIPDGAFSTSDITATEGFTNWQPNFSPGLLLQAMYYQQLSSRSEFFGNLYSNIMGTYATSSTTSPSTAIDIGHRTQTRLQQQHFQSPKQLSTFARNITPIPIYARVFRMLNSANKPYLLVFAYSQPQKVLLAQYLKDHTVHHTALIHYVAAYDSTWHLIGRKKELGAVDVNDFINDSTLNYTRTFALMPQQTGEHLAFSAQIKNFDTNANLPPTPDGMPGISNKLMAASHMTLNQPPALSTNPSSLEMSDPIIGYEKGPESMSTDSLFVPFYVPPQNNIAYGKDLWLHFQLYHLHPDKNGISRYTLHYGLNRIQTYHTKRGEHNGKTNASLDLQMSARGSRTTHDLDIRVEDLIPGLYKLTLTATDSGGRHVTRHAEVRILEHVRN